MRVSRRKKGDPLVLSLVIVVVVLELLCCHSISPHILESIILIFPEKGKKNAKCHISSASCSLCIVVISCNQSNYPWPVLAGLFEFITQAEPNLSYELIWIDQASVDRASFSRLYRFDQKFLFAKRVGSSVSFRLAFFQCTREYILLLEEDWMAVNMSLPWFSFSMDLLSHAPESTYAILLCMVSMSRPIYKTTIQSCLIPSGTVWRFGYRSFHFTEGPAIYRVSTVRQILAKHDDTNGYGFTEGMRKLGYTLSFWADGMVPPSEVPIRFRRTGGRFTK
jgi:hypothetical protein